MFYNYYALFYDIMLKSNCLINNFNVGGTINTILLYE